MPDLFLVFNHKITFQQEEDARRSLEVGRIVDLPPGFKDLWKSVPPELPEITGYLEPVKKWLGDNAAPSDYVLIQGDFGACFIMVNFAIANGLIPVYATTDRNAAEEHGIDGSVTLVHRFQHQIFRKYGI